MSESIETMISRLTERQRDEFALACARRVQHLMRDPRSIAALDTRERWLRGEATDEEMNAARAAARDAARDARDAAEVSAWDAASTAAWSAALAAARAAGDAEWAARDAAWAEARAARDAAWDAARDAARDAVWAAVWVAERKWQSAELERMLGEGGGA